MINYDPLWATLKKKQVTTYELIYKHNIDPKTINNLKHNKNTTLLTIEKLCKILDCGIEEIVRFTDENG